MKLFIHDFESASELNVKIAGVHNYATHKSTRPLMMAYTFFDTEKKVDEPIHLWEPHKELLPAEILDAIRDPGIMKAAWAATFERYIWWYTNLTQSIPIDQFLDIMVWARHLSLPGALDKAGQALGLPQEKIKTADGKRLIQKFSMPFHKGGEETLFGISEPQWHDWNDEPRDWERFGEYCKQDVVSEREIFKIVSQIPLPEREQKAWILDQKINDRGIPTNRKFVENALAMSVRAKDELVVKLKELTGLKNPNSRNQFLGWAQQRKYPFLSLGKNFVTAALAENSGITPELRTALKLRQEASKTSYTKFETILQFLSADDRLRNQFAFLGGARTGRWAGRDAQVQNQARPMKEVEKKYERAVEIILAGDYEAAKKEFSSVLGMCISCIRSSFQAPEGKKLVVCDLSAIENRMLGWLADCQAILQVFRDGKDPYIDFAAKMYRLVYETLIKIVGGIHKAKDGGVSEKRQVAKPPVLGAGYGLGPGATKHCSVCEQEVPRRFSCCQDHPNAKFVYRAIIKQDQYGNEIKTGLMGYAANMGIDLMPEQAYLAWETFNKSYPEVTDNKIGLWKKYEKAAMKVLESGQPVRLGKVLFSRRQSEKGVILRIQLPSGRGLHYIGARIQKEIAQNSAGEDYEKRTLIYEGIGHGVGKIGTGQSKWGPVKTYGGKLTENIDQAISRDILLEGMFLVEELGGQTVMHVHDELVIEVDESDPFAFGLADLKHCMETVPEWAPGLLLAAEGWEGRVYRK